MNPTFSWTNKSFEPSIFLDPVSFGPNMYETQNLSKHNYRIAQKILSPNLSEATKKQSPKKGGKVHNFLPSLHRITFTLLKSGKSRNLTEQQ